MLEELSMTDLGVIAESRITFDAGLTVISGETGAGKTMLLTGLDLLLGGKADRARIRTGADDARVEGRFSASSAQAVQENLPDLDITPDDDGTLIIARTLTPARSRSFIGGGSVPQAVLTQLAPQLVTVHGQSDQLRLRSASHQRAALDRFGGSTLIETVEAYRASWAQLTELEQQLDTLEREQEARSQEADYTRQLLAEFDHVNPQPGEDTELAGQASRLAHGVELRQLVQQAQEILTGNGVSEDGIRSAFHESLGNVEQAAGLDESLTGIVKQFTDLGYRLDDLSSELSSYLATIETDPQLLEQVEERRAQLIAITRRHGSDLAKTLEWAEQVRIRLDELDGDDDRRAELRSQVALAREERDALAARLTALRTEAAAAMSAAVTAELSALAMPTATFSVRVTALDEPGPWGGEEIQFLLQPHPGAQATPMTGTASGGELSRIMLAIEVALASAADGHADDARTFVFDEIDAGVGGEAAIEVGRRLAALAQQVQVVVVTHLAQVAAFADHHIVVHKDVDDETSVTASDVREVEGEDRLRELARMLSGQSQSSTAQAHAQELLSLADMA